VIVDWIVEGEKNRSIIESIVDCGGVGVGLTGVGDGDGDIPNAKSTEFL